MSFAFLPLYTGDYIRDTQHLSLLEHGAYIKLLMYCWDQKGPAPHDERRLMGICNARSKEEITAVYSILGEYFVKMDDGWYNTRLVRELQKSEAISHNRAEAGRLGGIARASKQMLGKCQAKAKHLSVTPTPIPIPIQKEEGAKAPMSGKPDENIAATKLLNYLNEIAGRAYKPVRANIDLIRARLREYPVEELMRMLDGKVEEWRYDDKMHKYLRPETLFNATKCAQYIGEIGVCVEATRKEWI